MTNVTTTENSAAVAVPAVKLTRTEKYAARIAILVKRITADTIELEAVKLESTTVSLLDSVTAGTKITARLGRQGSEAREAVAGIAEVRDELGNIITAGVAAVAARAATAGTLRIVPATVMARADNDNGSPRFKISYGEGFDFDTETIQASQIVEVLSGAAAPVEVIAPAVELVAAAPLTRKVYTVEGERLSFTYAGPDGSLVDQYGNPESVAANYAGVVITEEAITA
jgi:hypothetical protein